MSQITEALNEAAKSLRMDSATEVAVGLLKEAGFSEEDSRYQIAQHELEKEACNHLVMSGIDIEQAVSMVKAAGINVKDLGSFKLEPEENFAADILEKAASYISILEAELEQVKSAQHARQEYEDTFSDVALPEPITKAASIGAFTNEDLAALKKMDQELITKMASAMDQPWEMGQATGYARPQTDPLLEFIVG